VSEEETSGKDLPIKDTADAVRGALQEVPVYRDAIQPAAKKLGVELKAAGTNLGVAVTTVTEGINVALAPLSSPLKYCLFPGINVDRLNARV
jgi:hypothetical protein